MRRFTAVVESIAAPKPLRLLAGIYATHSLRLSVEDALGRPPTRDDAAILSERWFPAYSRILTLDRQVLCETILYATGFSTDEEFRVDGAIWILSTTDALGASLVNPEVEMPRLRIGVETWWEANEAHLVRLIASAARN